MNDYAIDLRIMHIADAADLVKRIQTESRAGRKLTVQWICYGSTARISAR